MCQKVVSVFRRPIAAARFRFVQADSSRAFPFSAGRFQPRVSVLCRPIAAARFRSVQADSTPAFPFCAGRLQPRVSVLSTPIATVDFILTPFQDRRMFPLLLSPPTTPAALAAGAAICLLDIITIVCLV